MKLEFEGEAFTLVGRFHKRTRRLYNKSIRGRGGSTRKHLTEETDYLVTGTVP